MFTNTLILNIRNLNTKQFILNLQDKPIFLKKNKTAALLNRRVLDKNFKLSNKIRFCSPYFWKKIFLFQQNKVFKLSEKKIFSRSSVIPYGFLRQYVKIHNGKKWFGRVIKKWNVGFKFGELTWNRRIALYKAKQLKKKKKK